MNSPVLVLNQNYEPLNVCNAYRAIVLLGRGKAEVLEHRGDPLSTATTKIPRPSVIRMVYLIRRPRPRVKLNRREVFQRDGYTCQYCGVRTKDLTLDHIQPRHRGGKHTWENLVSACRPCNHRKGGKTPDEAKMVLLRRPFEPRATAYQVFHAYLQTHREWEKFLPDAHQLAGG